MAFVNEWRMNDKGLNDLITVDRDRNAELIHHFPKPEFSYQLELRVAGNKILLDVEKHAPIIGSAKIDINWNVKRAYGDQDLLSAPDRVQKLVTEALNVYGNHGYSDDVGAITVDFSKTQWV